MPLEERTVALLVAQTAVSSAHWALKLNGKNPEPGGRPEREGGAGAWKRVSSSVSAHMGDEAKPRRGGGAAVGSPRGRNRRGGKQNAMG